MNSESLDNFFLIDLSKEYYKCYLTITDTFSDISYREFITYLNSKEVEYGLKETNIRSILNGKFNLNKKILIAEATKPTFGKDGSVVYLKSEELSVRKNALGVADFYNTGIVKTIVKGEELVRIIAPSKGDNGKNIKGKLIESKLGKEVDFLKIIGEGVRLSEDSKYIIATRNGCYKRQGKTISIIEKLEIKQNLNFSIGNFNTTTTVEISGDIKYGFTIKAESDLLVHGVIEDAVIEIGEDIICKSGITKGTKLLKAGKSIRTKYINNKKNIICNDLFVEGYIFTSEIRAINSIYSNTLSGGEVTAGTDVDVDVLGNKHNIKTIVNIGLTKEDIQGIILLKNEIYNLSKKLTTEEKEFLISYQLTNKAIKSKTIKLKQIKNKSLLLKFEKEKELKLKTIEDLRNEIKKMKGLVTNKQKQLDFLNAMKEEATSRVIVRGDVYPGTTINYNTEKSYTVGTKMSKVVFKLNSEGELKPFNITEVDGI